MTNSPPFAVIIVSWNVRDLLARCLDSLWAELEAASLAARVVVVDNASQDGSVELLRARYPRVEVLASDRNLGFAGGNNLGLNHVRVMEPGIEFVLLLNPDTEVQPGAIQTLLAAIQSQPAVAIVTSRLSYGDGSFQPSAFHFPGLAQLYLELLPAPARWYESCLNGRYPQRLYESAQPFEIDHPLGAVMLLRGAAIRQVGLFDEGFALYCEEIDWCARFKAAGWHLWCVPSARVIHYSGRSTSQVRVAAFIKLWTARYRLHAKHPEFAPLPVARWIVRWGMRRRRRGASAELQAACQQIIEVWNGQPVTPSG